MPIKDKAYNDAKAILTKAGSKSAAKTHTSHTGGQDRPDGHGQDLVDECTKEFQKMDKGTPVGTAADQLNKKVNMTNAHFDAIQAAKKKLGLR